MLSRYPPFRIDFGCMCNFLNGPIWKFVEIQDGKYKVKVKVKGHLVYISYNSGTGW